MKRSTSELYRRALGEKTMTTWELARALGVSQDTVNRDLRALAELRQVITVGWDHRDGRQGRAKLWRVRVPADDDVEAEMKRWLDEV